MSQQVAMNFVDVNGARLKYESRGEGHPLVLVHGGLADMRMWDEHMEPLARRFRVIRFDLRGFGESVMPPGSFSFHEDFAGLLHALDISSAYMLGLSFGGKIALDFTLEHPEMVDALILVGASLGGIHSGRRPPARSKLSTPGWTRAMWTAPSSSSSSSGSMDPTGRRKRSIPKYASA